MIHKTIIEPFKIKSVEPITLSNERERLEFLKKAHYNPFLLKSEQVIIDFLTDSGTSAMSVDQWAGIMKGDESYAGSKSWIKMEKAVKELTGMNHILPTHQGRAAERILYGNVGGAGKVFISNTHFDTTRANIEIIGSKAIDIPISKSSDSVIDYSFKGNIDIEKLVYQIKENGPENIGAVILTLTNNSGGGQPVSFNNVKQTSEVCKKYNVLFILDCCRIAENTYFIKTNEEGFSHYSYENIAKEIFNLADGAVMSSKKDALVNMGGFLAIRDDKIALSCTTQLIITEGFSTYGGLSGRDMEALAIGIKEVFDSDYLEYRIKSTTFLGNKLNELGIPVILPIGGHAVYIDAKQFYSHIPYFEYPGQALVCELYLKGGIRSVEIGSVMFGKYSKDGDLIAAPMELVRLAIPRRTYTQSHIEYVVETFKELLITKNEVSGFKITEEPVFLRHFTAKFHKVPLKKMAH